MELSSAQRIEALLRYKKAIEAVKKLELYNVQNNFEVIDLSRLSPFQRLDLVLEYMETVKTPPYSYFTDIQNNLKDRGIILGAYSDELYRILEKLEQDNYIATELDDKKIKRYKANFDGNLFLAKGGYYQQDLDLINERKRLEANALRIEKHDRWIKYAGIGAALGAILLLIWDILKFFLSGSKHDWICAWLFLALSTLLIYNLVRKLP